MFVVFLLFCFCVNDFVGATRETSSHCKAETNVLLMKEISSLKKQTTQLQTEVRSLKNVVTNLNDLIQQSLIQGPVPSTLTPSSRNRRSKTSIRSSKQGNSGPMDCSDIFAEGQSQSGIYEIFPLRNQLNQPLDVFCDMEDGGGWTVFLLRDNAAEHVDFNRNWNDYKEFFGSGDQEYWIGNENLHALTSNRKYEVRFDAKDGERHTWQGWNSFSVASEENGYRLTVKGYNDGSTIRKYAGFGVSDRMKFTTFDKDNDPDGQWNCAERSKGGWWYRACSSIFPTAIHGKKYPDGVRLAMWSKKDGSERYPNWLQIKIRPTN